jgi:hypothetical protein
VDKKHVKSAQTRMHIEVQDPEAAKDAADREALRLEKDAELLKKKRAAALRGGGYGKDGRNAGASARVDAGYAEYFDRGAGLDGDFLEADDDDGDGDDAAMDEETEKAAAQLKRSAPGGYDDEAAFEEDEAAPAAKKRRGRALESDSEE